MQFTNASKQGDIIAVTMNVWVGKNQADVNQADFPVDAPVFPGNSGGPVIIKPELV